jgi:hypothetical protein
MYLYMIIYGVYIRRIRDKIRIRHFSEIDVLRTPYNIRRIYAVHITLHGYTRNPGIFVDCPRGLYVTVTQRPN